MLLNIFMVILVLLCDDSMSQLSTQDHLHGKRGMHLPKLNQFRLNYNTHENINACKLK